MKQTIKTFLLGVLCTATCYALSSCNNNASTGHDHSHSEEVHDHAHHDHDGHSHEGHDHHAHEGHSHEGHDHGHSHEGGNASPDEITLSAESAAAAGVTAEVIVPGPFRGVLEVSGRIMPAPEDETTVVASVPGIVSFAAPLIEGSRVNEGSPMFTISSRHLQDGDPVQRAKIEYETARQEYERAAKLVEDNIVSRQEYEAAKGRYETARLTYEALASNDGENGTVVKSPIKGYVRNCLVKEGDYVTVGTPLAGVITGSKLYLKADVSERYLNRLPGVNDANFKLSYGDRVYTASGLGGRLLGYGRSTDETNAYIPVTFAFNGTEDILPGAFAQVWLLSAERDGVISLPVEAVTESQGHYFVFIKLDETCYKKQEVILGATDGQRYEILSGLKGGENVVTRGATHVKLASASNLIPAHTHNH